MTKKYAFISVFPEIFVPFSQSGIVKKATDSGLIQIKSFNPRDFLSNKERIDDKVYGGGPGMVLKSEPIQKSINHAKDTFSGSSDRNCTAGSLSLDLRAVPGLWRLTWWKARAVVIFQSPRT